MLFLIIVGCFAAHSSAHTAGAGLKVETQETLGNVREGNIVAKRLFRAYNVADASSDAAYSEEAKPSNGQPAEFAGSNLEATVDVKLANGQDAEHAPVAAFNFSSTSNLNTTKQVRRSKRIVATAVSVATGIAYAPKVVKTLKEDIIPNVHRVPEVVGDFFSNPAEKLKNFFSWW
uniref:RxLR effector protein n=1 Tax=Trichuris muris TaxID=70415 RepID=A0A5S6Q7P8_TRIMR